MKKVLFIVPSLKRAGAETQIVDLVNALDGEKIERHLLSFDPDLSQLNRVRQDEVNFHHVVRRSKYDTSYIQPISKIIDEYQIDVMHCTLQFSLLVGWLARMRAERKPKLLVTIHTTLNRGIKEELLDRLIYQWLLRLCNLVIFVCKGQADYWFKRYPALKAKSEVIYNGVDTARYDPLGYAGKGKSLRTKYGIAETAVVVSCIAGFRREKGHNNLIEAFSRISPDAVLLLAGDGEMRKEVEKLVHTKKLETRVYFLGNISDVRPLLAASDITVLASTSVETFSIAMLESMAMGVPMVASDIGGLSEAIRPGSTGYLVEPGDISGLAETLAKMVKDKQASAKMGVQARHVVEKEFSTEVMARRTEQAINSVYLV